MFKVESKIYLTTIIEAETIEEAEEKMLDLHLTTVVVDSSKNDIENSWDLDCDYRVVMNADTGEVLSEKY